MPHNHRSPKYAFVVCGVLIALLSIALIMNARSARNAGDASRAREQTLALALLSEEAAVRGYLLSSDTQDLARSQNCRAAAAAALSNVESNPQADGAAEMASLAGRRLQQIDHALQLQRAGQTAQAATALQDGASVDATIGRLAEAAAASDGSDSEESGPGGIEGAVGLLALIVIGAGAILIDRMQRVEVSPAPETEPVEREIPVKSSNPERNEEKFQRIVETSQEGIWVVNTLGETTFANSRLAEILGYSLKEILGRQHVDFMDDEGLKIAEENSRRKKLGLDGEEDFRFVKKDGTIVWALVTTSPLKDGDGNVTGALAMVTDITHRKRVEQEHVLYKSAIQAGSNGVAIVDARRPDFPIVIVNPAFEQITGYRVGDSIGHAPDMLRGEDRSGRTICPIQLAVQQGMDNSVELKSRRHDETEYWQEVFVAPIHDEHGAISHYAAIQNDVSRRHSVMEALQQARLELEDKVTQRTAELQNYAIELQQANQKLTALATQDEITGLNNNRIFLEHLDQEYKRSGRYSMPLSVLVLDIDRFRDYNDSLGHAAGDEALRQIGDIVRSASRQTDVPARIRDDRFAVIMVNTDQANSTVLAERLRRNVERHEWDSEHSLSASVGVATLDASVKGVHMMLDRVDAALRSAKRDGGNRTCHAMQQECGAVAA